MDVKKIFLESMVTLLKEKTFKEITVQMILDTSTLSRATFYRYYKDKYDLMNDFYRYHFEKLMSERNFDTWYDRLVVMYDFMQNNIEYFKKVFGIEGVDSFFNFLTKYTYDYCEKAYKAYYKVDSLSEKVKYDFIFISTGEVNIVKSWINKKHREDIQTIAQWTYNYLPDEYKKILDAQQ